jgi:protein-tyrosine phosphatase
MQDIGDQKVLNYRDVGVELARRFGCNRIPRGVLLRGGRLDLVTHPGEIGSPRTIVNLRLDPDQRVLEPEFGVSYHQFAASNDLTRYDTSLSDIRVWLRSIMAFLATLPDSTTPIYFHCRSGRDRTGVVVALLLYLAGVPRDIVISEFLLSSNAKREHLELTLKPFATRDTLVAAFKKIDTDRIVQLLTTPSSVSHMIPEPIPITRSEQEQEQEQHSRANASTAKYKPKYKRATTTATTTTTTTTTTPTTTIRYTAPSKRGKR